MTEVRKEITIDAPVERVWEYLVDKDKLASWMMNIEGDLALGETFRFTAPPNNKWDGVIVCRVLEMAPPLRLAFTWDNNLLEHETRVTITLEATEDSGTRLTLVHDRWEGVTGDLDERLREHSDGWSEHLEILLGKAGSGGD